MKGLSAHSSKRIGRSEERWARRWHVVGQCVVDLALTIACQSALAQGMYRIQPLGLHACTGSGFLDAAGLNEADEVTGQACDAKGDAHAFLWENNGTPAVDLGPPEAGSTSQGDGINASGLVGGDASDSTGNFLFLSSGDGKPMKRIYDGVNHEFIQFGAINNLGQLMGVYILADGIHEHAFLLKNDGSPMIDLTPHLARDSVASAMNDSTEVAGSVYLSDTKNTTHAFVWKNDGKPIFDLGTLGGDSSDGYLINASGEIAGISDARHSVTDAFLWRNDGTPMQDLGNLGAGFSFATTLNDAGQVAGVSTVPATQIEGHAFVWKNDGTPMKDLGTLGGTASEAYHINSSGQVAGYANLAGDLIAHAFLWRNDGTRMQDLNKLIDPTDPLKPYITLTSADIINDRSDILAEGTDSRTGLAGLYLLQSTGVATSVITLAPRSLTFGNVPIATSSTAQSVTVTNTGPNSVDIAEIALRGAAPKQFTFTKDCNQSLAGHATCTIKVTFKPTTTGPKTAYLDVNGGGGGLRSVKLTGTGT